MTWICMIAMQRMGLSPKLATRKLSQKGVYQFIFLQEIFFGFETHQGSFSNTLQWRIQDFPEEGAPTPQGGRQHKILRKFLKNCMKLIEFGPQGTVDVPCTPEIRHCIN